MTTELDLELDEIAEKMHEADTRTKVGTIMLRASRYRHRRAKFALEVIKVGSDDAFTSTIPMATLEKAHAAIKEYLSDE